MTRLLKIQTEYFRAGAVWKKVYGIWSCTSAAPIVRWMKGKSKEQVHLELLKMGAVFQWVDLPKLSEHRKSAFPEGITVNRSNPLPSPVAASGDRQKHGAMPTTRTAWNETKFYSKAM